MINFSVKHCYGESGSPITCVDGYHQSSGLTNKNQYTDTNFKCFLRVTNINSNTYRAVSTHAETPESS